MMSFHMLALLSIAPVVVSQWPLCISVEREIDAAFDECYSSSLRERCVSESILDRMNYCFPERDWMAAVWSPHDLSRRHACYDCSPRGSFCSCYTGTNVGLYDRYFYNVASSWCRPLNRLQNIPAYDRHACNIRNDIRRYYEGNGQSPLCAHGAVRYDGLPNGQAAGIWVSATSGRCFQGANALDDYVTMWAFR